MACRGRVDLRLATSQQRAHAVLQHLSLAPARVGHRRRSSAVAQADSTAERCEVVDYILLCATNDGLTQEAIYASFSEILSLMYMVPNILIGFTGPVKWQSDGGVSAPYQHALHFRLADRASAEGFMTDPEKINAFQKYLKPISRRYTEAVFSGTVVKEMDSMFRRSDQWAVGAEHVAWVANNPACPSDEPDTQLGEYTHLLTQVAESPVAGAVQSMAGPVLARRECSAEHGRKANEPTGQMIMSRFQTVEEAQAYSKLPPCDALRQGDTRCPGVSVQEVIFEIEPIQGSEAASAVV